MTRTGGLHTASRRQTPHSGRLAIDHIAHFVADLAIAQRVLSRLGFTLTPRSEQSNRRADGRLAPAGAANCCAMLREGYLELLTPTADTPLAAQMRAAMTRHDGVHLLAFGTADPLVDSARLEAAGFAPQPIVDLRRRIETVAGARSARFSVLRVPHGLMPEGRVQFVRHLTPGLLWQSRWLGHENGAVALRAVLIAAADPVEAAARYARFTGLAPDGARLATARGLIEVLTADQLRARYAIAAPKPPAFAGYVLATTDLAAARRCARRAGCAIHNAPGGLTVIAPPAIGGAIVFVAA